MAEKCRSLNFFLLICALASGLLFYGCGGGTSSDPLPVMTLQITGNVTSSVQLANMIDDNGLLPDIRASFTTSNIEVYLESNRAQFSTRTDSSGNYILSGVPAGTHHVIALFTTSDNKIFKVRSGPISVSSNERVVQVAALPLVEATATVSGRIVDTDGNPVANARLSLWGEFFYTDASGIFTTPPLPVSSTPQNIITEIPGFQSATIAVEFSANTPFIEQMVVGTAAVNRPPVSTLKANRYSVSANGQVTLTATASDPENGTLTYAWSASTGTIANSANNLSRTWTAPDSSSVATITFSATDVAGLRSTASVLITVGAGQIGQNVAPVVLEFNANSATFLANTDYQLTVIATDSNNDTLYYTWTASQGSIIAPNTTTTVVWKTPAVTSLTNVQVTVKVDDKKGGVVYQPRTFQVSNDPNQPANQSPVVTITSPANNSLHLPGVISYSGQATDPEETTVSVTKMRWLEAKPGSSAELVADQRASFSKNIFVPGTYTLTLQARDSLDAVGSQTIQFRINATPTVSITSPVAGTYGIGSTVTFNAAGNDTEDGALAASRFTWLFPAPVGVQTGNNLPINNLPMGVHTIGVSAKDSMGANSATTTVQVTIANTGPTMNIISPAENSVIPVHQLTTISGDGTGFNSQVINPATFKWEYRQFADTASTTLATGVDSVVASFTKLGLHTLTLTGIDSANVSSVTRRLFYVNATPTVQITTPASGVRFDLNAPIFFAAAVSDPDATDTPLSVRWYRDNGATPLQFGTGTTYLSQIGDLPAGNRQIGCEVLDSHGVASHSMINVLVNSLPTATITYSTPVYATGPASRPIFLSPLATKEINFTAQTFDAEGAIVSNNIRWFNTYQNNTSQVGTGTSLIYSLQTGISTITLVVYDSFYPQYEHQASASVSLMVQVWQERIYTLASLGIATAAVDLTGEPAAPGANLLFSLENPNQVVTASYKGQLGADFFDNDILQYDTGSSSMPAEFSNTYAAVKVGGKIMALGMFGANEVIKEFETIATISRTLSPFPGNLVGARSMSTDGTRLYVSYPGVNKICMINNFNGEITNTLLEANTQTFLNPNKIRYSDRVYGKVFVADKGRNRIVRFSSELLGSPLQPLTVTSPEDVAFSNSYVLTIDRTNGRVTVVDPFTMQSVMNFGAAGTASGQFNDARAIYCSGNDLFVLEPNRVKIIRSGEADWLQ